MKKTIKNGNAERHHTVESYDSVVDAILKSDQILNEEWKAAEPKRLIAVMLGTLRAKMGLSQKDICDKTGWNKAYVSRLEAAVGGVPDTQTIARYVSACDAVAEIVIKVKDSDGKPTFFSSTLLNGPTNGIQSYSYEQSAEILEEETQLKMHSA